MSKGFEGLIIGKDLPVSEELPKLFKALTSRKTALLEAPPGAGKTTLVPLALLELAGRSWLKNKKIIMLEPRRLAARASAFHMAGILGESPGQTIGYQVRNERAVGPRTRVEIITEGILTRKIQSDPSLKGVGLVIFDEFHERHIHSDLGLALCLEGAEVFNEDLRILVMSATMDMTALSRLMDQAPMISSQGRTYPVITHYVQPESCGAGFRYPGSRFQGILAACLSVVSRALDSHEGDILVFLPGAAQIRIMHHKLTDCLGDKAEVLPLFGNLSPGEQARAISPSLPGNRKIVLATSIAETSLTIKGVRVVVDTGLVRVPKFSPGTGTSRLETIAVSKASADQRRGRAGRTAPGICYRLWSEHVHKGLVAHSRPEILSADLTSLALELAQWGVSDPLDLKWLDPPPANAFSQARDLLKQLDALDGQGRITAHGKRLLSAGIHPRLSHMILRADNLGQGVLACQMAALVEEKDFIYFKGEAPDPDICLRLEILESLEKGKSPQDLARGEINVKQARTILKNAKALARRLGVKSCGKDHLKAGRILALAWPGRVGKKRNNRDLSYVLASGSGAYFRSANGLSAHSYIVAVHLDGNLTNACIFLGAFLAENDLEDDFDQSMSVEKQVVWDPKSRSVKAFERKRFLKLVIRETPMARPDPEAVCAALIEGVHREGLSLLPWTKPLLQFRHRVMFLKNHGGNFDSLPDLSEEHLLENLSLWLSPFLSPSMIRSWSAAGLKQMDLSSAIKSQLSWEEQKMVDIHAPTHIKVPSGSRLPLVYMEEKGLLEFPVLAVRLQEMFGLAQTPSVAGGQIPVTLHLLSPAGRPVQITRDLESFWKNTYQEVKKDLMGRYPKHYWPDNPMEARATARAKPGKRK